MTPRGQIRTRSPVSLSLSAFEYLSVLVGRKESLKLIHDQIELLFEYLYWIGCSLDFIAAPQLRHLDEDAPGTLLYDEPDMPPHPSPIEYREVLRSEIHANRNQHRWRPA